MIWQQQGIFFFFGQNKQAVLDILKPLLKQISIVTRVEVEIQPEKKICKSSTR
jgi:hypothetical protein